jgi:hypothetical protein
MLRLRLRPAAMIAAGIALIALSAPRTVHASPLGEALWKAEIQAAYGLSVGGSGEAMSRRPTPLTINAIAAIAFSEDPPLSIYGGLTAETLDRNAAGIVTGLELNPYDSVLHVAGGVTALVTPYTLWGATISGGVCGHLTRSFGLCLDLVLTAFLGGSDLPEGRTVSQGQLALGLMFDAP